MPKGKRGILIAKFFYEEQMKLKTRAAAGQDPRAGRGHARPSPTDPDLQRYVKENQRRRARSSCSSTRIKTRQAVGAAAEVA